MNSFYIELTFTITFFLLFLFLNLIGEYLQFKKIINMTIQEKLDENILLFNLRYKKHKEKIKRLENYIKVKKYRYLFENESCDYREIKKYLKKNSVKSIYYDFKNREELILKG